MASNFRAFLPIVAKERRADGKLYVRARMTSETLDTQGEIVDYAGAKRAAEHWQGNIRDGHFGPGVGKRVDMIFDDDARTIDVEFFVSKGAPDTQEKVLDGTLAGVSVEGEVAKDDSGKTTGRVMTKADDSLLKAYPKAGVKKGAKVSILKDWRQTALALVDAPANREALEILKVSDGAAIVGACVAKEDEMPEEEVVATPAEPAAPAGDALAILGQITELVKQLAALKADAISEEGVMALSGVQEIIRGIEYAKQEAASKAACAAMENVMTKSDAPATVAKAESAASVQVNEELVAQVKELADILAAASEKLAGVMGRFIAEEKKESAEPEAKADPEAEPVEKVKSIEKSAGGDADVLKHAAGEIVSKALESVPGIVAKAVADAVGSLEGQISGIAKRVETVEKTALAPRAPRAIVDKVIDIAKSDHPLTLADAVATLPQGLSPIESRERLRTMGF